MARLAGKPVERPGGGGTTHSSLVTSVAGDAGLRTRRRSVKIGGRGASGTTVTRSMASVDDNGAVRLPEPWRRIKAHGRRGRAVTGNRGSAQRTRQRSNASKSRVVAVRQHFGAVGRRRRNGKEATAVVTRYGCSRVDFFEGCETRCGVFPRSAWSDEVALGRRVVALGRRSHLRMTFGSGGHGDGNTANPFRHRDATSPGAQCGANRRGGEKPRGRNVTVRLAPCSPKEAETSLGVDTLGHSRRRGHSA
jgi:hypothetical protein